MHFAALALWFIVMRMPDRSVNLLGPYPSKRICQDWNGSIGSCEHGPTCILGLDCSCQGPGIAASIGATTDDACIHIGYKRGYYFFDAEAILHGPLNLKSCKKHSDECFGIGRIPNTEGSRGGP
jgi:hypothetical protein